MRFDFTIHRLHSVEMSVSMQRTGFSILSMYMYMLSMYFVQTHFSYFILFHCDAQKHRTEQNRVLCAVHSPQRYVNFFFFYWILNKSMMNIFSPHSGVIYQVLNLLCNRLGVYSSWLPLRHYSTAWQTCLHAFGNSVHCCYQFAGNLSLKCQTFEWKSLQTKSFNSPAFLQKNREVLLWFLLILMECSITGALQRQR